MLFKTTPRWFGEWIIPAIRTVRIIQLKKWNERLA
jgi:hypothetical protein